MLYAIYCNELTESRCERRAGGVKDNLPNNIMFSALILMQIEDNLASVKFIKKLTPEILSKIDDIFGNKPQGVKTYFSFN